MLVYLGYSSRSKRIVKVSTLMHHTKTWKRKERLTHHLRINSVHWKKNVIQTVELAESFYSTSHFSVPVNRLIQENGDLFSESQCKVCNAVLISESQKLAHYQVAHFIFSAESNVCVFRNRFDLESTATCESNQGVD